MDRLNPEKKKEKEREGKKSIKERVKEQISLSLDRRKEDRLAPVLDILTFIVGILFARCHIIFGSHPIAIAFISVLPTRVWLSVLGSCVGSLTLGGSGIIYAMISVIVVFLRIIVSGTDKKDIGTVEGSNTYSIFNENLMLRMSAALIGGFIGAVYEVLLSGFSMTSVAFGVSMILLPPIIVFALSGLFDTGVGVAQIFCGNSQIFSLKGKAEKERFELIFYQCSALLLTFLVSISLAEYVVFGINLSYIFAAAAALLVSRRFGALRGAAIGFAASLGLSSTYSVAFALLGLAAGMLFKIGIAYSLIGGGFAIGAWCAYAGGIGGFLSTIPEYGIAALLTTPILKKIATEKTDEEKESTDRSASEMLGTVALSYKNKYSGSLDALEASLTSISAVIRKYGELSARPTLDELYDLIIECSDKYCRTCDGYRACIKNDGRELISNVAECATILFEGGRLSPSDLGTLPEYCGMAEGLSESINRAAAILAEEKYKAAAKDSSADDVSLISKLIAEARSTDDKEKTTNERLSDSLNAALPTLGISDGMARVYGERNLHFIVVADDETGKKVSSEELKDFMERESGVRVDSMEYFRRGRMALLECSAGRSYSAECATAGIAGNRDTVSGDTVRSFESRDGFFYTLISDGMGSGKEAKTTSEFVTEFLSRALEFSSAKETVLKMLSHIIKRKNEECSATLDLFEIDLINGNAVFFKGGAAPSYVKRGSSIFRIRSRTAPLGVLKDVDIERIKVDIESDDYIIMLSDGIIQNADDAPWLLELLSKPPKRNLTEYADLILNTALKNLPANDDMTVAVTKIKRI